MKQNTIPHIKKMANWMLILLMAGSITNCSDTNPEAPSSDAVHTSSWINPQFLTSDNFHGTSANQDGSNSCMVCHGTELQGNTDIPGCFSCHFGPDGSRAPEGSVWIHGQNQHSDFISSERICNDCHTLERRYGLDPGLCHDCHGEGINHATGQTWLDKNSSQFHGNDSALNCADCHNLSIYCATCHFGETGSKAPIGSGWNHGNNEEHQDLEGLENICNKCHNINRSYGNAPAACHDCHGQGISHVTGQEWLDKNSSQFHGNDSVLNCADCHDLGSYCATCHFGETGSKAPIGSGWNHGNNERHRRYESHKTICNQCHDLNRSFGNEPKRCHDCHD